MIVTLLDPYDYPFVALDLFLLNAGKSLETFRYYNKRNKTEAFINHIITILGYDSIVEPPVAYGHLDYENGKTWLGICVAEKHLNKGYGKQVMNYLLRKADTIKSDVYLTVDSDNMIAIGMYEKFGFEWIGAAGPAAITMKRTAKNG